MSQPATPHILVVDDEEAITYVFDRYLSIAGYRVTTANGGAEALRLFGADPATIVVTDFRMPGMNGVELIDRLRALAPGLPALLVSANPVDVQALPADVRFVPKPVSMQDLLGLVGEMVGG